MTHYTPNHPKGSGGKNQTMKVYGVWECINYSGGELFGVFSTEDLAQKWLSYVTARGIADTYHMAEMVVDDVELCAKDKQKDMVQLREALGITVCGEKVK